MLAVRENEGSGRYLLKMLCELSLEALRQEVSAQRRGCHFELYSLVLCMLQGPSGLALLVLLCVLHNNKVAAHGSSVAIFKFEEHLKSDTMVPLRFLVGMLPSGEREMPRRHDRTAVPAAIF